MKWTLTLVLALLTSGLWSGEVKATQQEGTENRLVYGSEVELPTGARWFTTYELRGAQISLALHREKGMNAKNVLSTPVVWSIPVTEKTRKFKVRNTVAVLTYQSIDAVRWNVEFTRPLELLGSKFPSVVANGFEVRNDGALVVYPSQLNKLTELEAPPIVIPADQTVKLSMASGETYAGSTSEVSRVEALLPSEVQLPASVKIPMAAMKQELAYGCVLNGIRLLMLQRGQAPALTEMLNKLGLTADKVNNGNGIPWSWYHMPDGRLYTALDITNATIVRATYAPPQDWLDAKPKPTTGVVWIDGGMSSNQSLLRQNRGNWRMHGILKRLLAQGHPVLVDLYAQRVSHVITVWGYDLDRKSYLVNMGDSDELKMLEIVTMDERWSGIRYDIAVIGSDNPGAAQPQPKPVPQAPAPTPK
jgi:hypothetical protein